jgi:hypothetical protein
MADVTPPPIRMRQGSTKNKQLRLPCKSCNNGWMSAREEEVKPILLPMMQGRQLLLDAEKIKTLATWVAMKIMVIEKLGTQMHSILSTQDRLAMKEYGTIPRSIVIQLLHCRDKDWLTRLEIHSAHISRVALVGAPLRNIQTVSFGLGEVYVHTITTGDPPISPAVLGRLKGAVLQLWPTPAAMAYWPPGPPITGDDALLIGRRLQLVVADMKAMREVAP